MPSKFLLIELSDLLLDNQFKKSHFVSTNIVSKKIQTHCDWNIDDLGVFGYACPPVDCGDVNEDNNVDVLDIVDLINSKYKDGPAPDPLEMADVNQDTNVDILDIVYLINFKYKEGPEPAC